MFVRIARFEGADVNEVDTAIERVGAMLEGERPPGLDAAKRFLMLVDRETGRGSASRSSIQRTTSVAETRRSTT